MVEFIFKNIQKMMILSRCFYELGHRIQEKDAKENYRALHHVLASEGDPEEIAMEKRSALALKECSRKELFIRVQQI